MEKRAEYVERLSEHMVEWDSQIDLIKGRVESTTPESKLGYSNAIEALHLKREEVKVKLEGISSASDDEWEGLKSGTEQSLGEVRTMFHEAVLSFNEQIS
jgi:hypothetical protein